MEYYLYGAAVQGIQSFIFQTNKLKEIAGASELVEQICTKQFENAVDDFNRVNAIVMAAGNVKYIFYDKASCEKVVKEFPKKVMEFAPGITISQAVVIISDGETISKEKVDELEKKLRAQRNKPFRPFDVGLMIMNRSRKTGLPAFEEEENERGERQKQIIDKGTACKLKMNGKGRVENSFWGDEQKRKVPYNIEHITSESGKKNSWIAIIHADGNNIGLKIQEMAEELKGDHNDYRMKFKKFSDLLDAATKQAARKAYSKMVGDKNNKDKVDRYEACRPIIIGGDDLTIIIRADLALKFTELYLFHFEEVTKEKFKDIGVHALKGGLTACAGIAFIKESYPFHYGYTLSEMLCGVAKKRAKGNIANSLTPSCLMFHKVQDSFVESYNEIRDRELTITQTSVLNGKHDKNKKIRLDFGPYYLTEHGEKPTISGLEENVSSFEDEEGNAVKSHLRQWLTDLHNNRELAEQKTSRVFTKANEDILKQLGLGEQINKGWTIVREGDEYSPVYDWLTIHSIQCNNGGK